MAPILEKFKASAVVVAVVLLILVLGQTQAAPSLPLPASYHFKYDNNDGTAGAAAKRGSGGDKGESIHAPAVGWFVFLAFGGKSRNLNKIRLSSRDCCDFPGITWMSREFRKSILLFDLRVITSLAGVIIK